MLLCLVALFSFIFMHLTFGFDLFPQTFRMDSPYNLNSGYSSKHIYGLQQPGCILCLTLVIFSFNLSQFCDMLWNVTMIMNICSIWQFCGQLLIQHKFFTQKSPNYQQQQKNYLKLWPILADSGWLWLTLANSGWLLMILTDSGWLCLTLADSYWPWIANSDRLWLTLADYGWLWLTLADSGWIWLTLTDSGRRPESARVIKSHAVLVRVSQSQPESARVSKSFR